MGENDLRNKTIKGVGWSAFDSVLGQGVTFIVGIVLARILSPDEYGLLGLITIFITVMNSIVDSGLSTSLIRKKDVTDTDYSTMFIANLLLSIVMYTVLFFSAPAISSFFERPELVALTRVAGLVIIINALSIVQYTLLSKRIDFKTKTKASFIAAILSGGVGIGMAFTGFGVWALVGQMLSKQFIYTVCLWIMNHWVPRMEFSKQSFHYMWGFGWKLLVSGLISTTWSQVYQMVVGKFYSPATLGQYTRSREYASIFSSNINTIVSRVSFPVLSEIQDDKQRLVAAYRKIITTTMFVTAVCMISMGAVAEPLIYCMIGPQWHQAATFLPFICISLSLIPLHAINLNMLKVQGRSDLFLKLEIYKKLISVVPICLGIFVDIYWMIIGSVFTGFIGYLLNSFYSGKLLGYSSWMQLKDVAPSYGVAFIIALSVYFLKYLPLSYWITLPMQIVVGIGVFFLVCETRKMDEYIEIKNIILSMLKKRNNAK